MTWVRAARMLGAATIVVGLCLPYDACDTEPIRAYQGPASALGPYVAIIMAPVLALVFYVLAVGALELTRRTYRVLYITAPFAVLALVFGPLSLGLLIWNWLRLTGATFFPLTLLPEVVAGEALAIYALRARGPGSKVPLLLLAAAIPTAIFEPIAMRDNLRWGGWLLTSGLAIAVLVEIAILRRAAASLPARVSVWGKLKSAPHRVAVFAALVGIAIALAFVRGGDGPPPEDSDLMAANDPPPYQNNAFLTLNGALALFHWPEDAPQAERLREMASGKRWDEALAASTLTANSQALEMLRRAAQQPALHSSEREGRYDEESAWADLSRLQGIRAIALARAGDGEAAISAALVCLHVARRMAADTNGSVSQIYAVTEIGNAGLEALRAIFGLVSFPSGKSREVANELASLRVDPDAWRSMLSRRYRESAYSSWSGLSPRLGVRRGPWLLVQLAEILPDSHHYQPNNTRALYANIIRDFQAAADRPCADAPTFASEPLTLRTLLRANPAGRFEAENLAPVDANRARCRFDTRVDALRAVIAVQAYEREHDSPPQSLEALVPGYLPTAPRDWLAGGSLRFDRSAREMTSFGFWDRKAYTEPREEHFPLLPAATSPGGARKTDAGLWGDLRAERFRTARRMPG